MSKAVTTLDDLMNSYDVKTAEAPTLPDNHPATGLDDATSVPTGSLIPDSTAPLIEEFGTLNPDSPGSPQNQKPEEKSVSIGTETGRVEQGLAPMSELKDGIPDPGPDSSHPASTDNTEKYASVSDIGALATAMAQQLNSVADMLTKSASAPAPQAPTATQPATSGYQKDNAVIRSMHPEQAKIANAILDATAAAPDMFNSMVRAHLTPYVELGDSRAIKLANFMAAAAEDPAAAQAMLGGGGEGEGMDPAAAAADMGEAMGGGGMGGEMGGEDPLSAAMAEIEQIAAESGATVDEVIDQLEDLLEGGGMGGEGEAAPEAVSPEAPAEPPAEPPAEAPADAPEKTAAAPKSPGGKQTRKEAQAAKALLAEVLRKASV